MKGDLMKIKAPYGSYLAINGSELSKVMGMRTSCASEDEGKAETDPDGKLHSVGPGHGGTIFSMADQAMNQVFDGKDIL